MDCLCLSVSMVLGGTPVLDLKQTVPPFFYDTHWQTYRRGDETSRANSGVAGKKD